MPDVANENGKGKGRWEICKKLPGPERDGCIISLRRRTEEPTVLATYASGYPPYYRDDEAEIHVLTGDARKERHGGADIGEHENPRDFWWPRTADFEAEARRSPVAVGVKDFQALLRAIRARKQLVTVYWFGHGVEGELQFGSGRKLTKADLGTIAAEDVSAHFAPGGEIIFAACNAGQSPEFLQGIADALRVTVRGFSKGVKWSVSYEGEAPKRKITKRGLESGSAALKSSGTAYHPKACQVPQSRQDRQRHRSRVAGASLLAAHFISAEQ